LNVRPVAKLFKNHPASVNETYVEHLGQASSFGLRMIGGGIACLLHGLLPFLFERTGSSQISVLHERMVTSRIKRQPRDIREHPRETTQA
jgi:hypothetical protein